MAPTVISAAFLIGLTGSLHCIAMCGPLAMTVPQSRNRWVSILLYNVSRLAVYSLLGFIFGSLGSRIGFLESGQRVSVVLGIVILLIFVVPAVFPGLIFSKLTAAITRCYGRMARPVMQYRGVGAPVALGAINGLLPCGLIYISLAGAVSSGSGLNGALLLAVIGAGTLPAMFSMMALRRIFKSWMQKGSRLALPLIAGMLAVSLIGRGLNLDIPFFSPKVEKVVTASGDSCQ